VAVNRGPSGTEWPATLDVDALLATGWRPTPFREFVLKINSRCDLSCDYCYVYEMADQRWREQPYRMSPAIVDRIAARIGEHVRAHDLTSIELVLHGGEPLLAGPELIARTVRSVRQAAGPSVQVGASIQTNGVRLGAYLELLDELDVRVGVSLDGDAAAHDRHRRFANGRASHTVVAAALDELGSARFRHLFGGLLCTIDVRNPPLATYEALLDFDPPKIDFLLPHGNWSAPPPGRVPGSAATPYADWLIAVFDRWYRTPRQNTEVRLFSEIIQLLLGGTSSSEAVGLSPAGMVVIETDGGIEQSDMLKSAYDGASLTGLHVLRHSFDEVLTLPSTAARQMGELALSAECRACEVRRVCGGGLYSHRYREGRGFANPSVYGPDLFRLITHIRRTVAADLEDRRDALLHEGRR
jgi:uncharacterized protein